MPAKTENVLNFFDACKNRKHERRQLQPTFQTFNLLNNLFETFCEDRYLKP